MSTPAHPYTGLLTKHVQSIDGKPIFYYEVTIVSNIQQDQADKKLSEFSIGFSADSFTGTKVVGNNKESIGLTAEGKVLYHCEVSGT